jgi:hypothetical protein
MDNSPSVTHPSQHDREPASRRYLLVAVQDVPAGNDANQRRKLADVQVFKP